MSFYDKLVEVADKTLLSKNELESKTHDLAEDYIGKDLSYLKTWEGDLNDLERVGLEFKVTKKYVKHLLRDVRLNYFFYLIRALITLVVIVGIPTLLVRRWPVLMGSAFLVGMIAFSIVMNGKVLMKPNLKDLKLYKSDIKCYILYVNSKYKVNAKSRGIIVNDLFIDLEHDANYFDFDSRDTVALVVSPEGEYRIHKA